MHEPLSVRTLEEAREEIDKNWDSKIQTEGKSLEDVKGQILAENVQSKIDLPPFDRAVYDGFAVRAEDTFGAEENDPVKLTRKGEVHAGENPEIKVSEGSCVEIATGAVIPEGADAVVMVEDTDEKGQTVEIRRSVSPEENISQKGSEIKKGEKIAEKGQKIAPQVRGALYGAGVKEVQVIRKPKVAVLSTGEEVVKPEKDLERGELYDINGPAVCDAVESAGGRSNYCGIVGDNIPDVKSNIRDALSQNDIVITSGGSSAGSKDLIPKAIDELGDPGVIIHGLAQKPGKPTLMAMVKGKSIFGLPGYPVSALMVFDQLVSPYIRELAGFSKPERKSLEAELSRKILSSKGRRQLAPVEVNELENKFLAEPLKKGSGAITALVKSDGYAEVPVATEILEKGEIVEVNLFGGGSFG